MGLIAIEHRSERIGFLVGFIVGVAIPLVLACDPGPAALPDDLPMADVEDDSPSTPALATPSNGKSSAMTAPPPTASSRGVTPSPKVVPRDSKKSSLTSTATASATGAPAKTS